MFYLSHWASQRSTIMDQRLSLHQNHPRDLKIIFVQRSLTFILKDNSFIDKMLVLANAERVADLLRTVEQKQKGNF